MPEYKEISRGVATLFQSEFEYHEDENSALIYFAAPIHLIFGKIIEGIQWYDTRVHVGIVEDRNALQLHQLLFDNLEKDRPYALRDLEDDTWLVVKDRYALSADMPTVDVATILWQRAHGSINACTGGLPMLLPGLDPQLQAKLYYSENPARARIKQLPGVRFWFDL